MEILVANPSHTSFAEDICALIASAAKDRRTGIAKREPAYIREKITSGKAVIAMAGDRLAGFCYIETWSHGEYVANSGLVVHPDFRRLGLARGIKRKAFHLARKLFPKAHVFGITTSLAVMKINTELGYAPVTYSELTQDEAFWKGCQSCPNYDILERNERKMCLCTAMLAPSREEYLMENDLTDLILENHAKI